MARRSGRLLLGLLIGGLLIGGLGFLTAGFTSFDPTEWANRFKPVIPEPDDDDDDDTTTDPDDTTDPDEDELGYNLLIIIPATASRYEFYETRFDEGFMFTSEVINLVEELVFITVTKDKIQAYFNYGEDHMVTKIGIYHEVNNDYEFVYFEEIELGYSYDFTDNLTKVVDNALVLDPVITEIPEEPAPQARHIGVQMAFGIDGRQELNVVLTPANADVNLSFSVDKTEVIVEKTGYKSADVYVTNYFAGYATITVTDSISGKTGTGKVYSYGKTILVSSSNLVQGYNGGFIVSNSSDPTESGGPHNVVAAGTVDYGLSYYNSTGEFLPLVHKSSDSFYSGDWIHLIDTVYFHVAYNGSFAPKIKNTSDNNAIYSKSNDVAKAPGVAQTIIEVELVEGYNDILIIGGETGGSVLAALTLVYAQAVSNMSVPDLTFIS